MFTVKIILPIKNIKKLIYYKKTNKNINIGKRVVVSLKNKNLIGIISNICKKKKNIKIKKIIKIIDKKKIVNKKWFKLIKICSIYYRIPFNIFLFNLIPKYTKKKYKKKIKYIQKISKPIKISKKYLKIINNIHIKKKVWLLITNFKKRINFYINIIKQNIKNNYQILILVPENYLIKKIKKYIYKKIHINIEIINSKICKKKKIKIWKKILDKKISIILGTRSTIFTPFVNLNLIIIEEEHSKYYKENRNFPYNAKNIALLRSKIENIPIILGSLTPSIKSYYKSKIKKYNIIKIKNPLYTIKKKILNINNNIIKKKIQQILKRCIKKKEKIYILTNINGYSWLICKYCKLIQKCYLCKIKYVFYKKKQIICYKCKKKIVLKKCIKCKKNKFYNFGWGTKKIKKHLIKLFPSTKIKIINSKFKKKKNQQIFISHKLIINKNIFKPNLIIFNIDNILFSNNYESIEKIIREYNIFIEKNYINKKQKIIFLTKYPYHYIYKNFLKFNNYENHIKDILKERKLINYPPYVHESSISIEYNNNNNIYKLYKIMNLLLYKYKKINILKPKLIKKKKYFWKIIIFSKLYKHLFFYIEDIKKKIKNKIKFKIDIDNNE